MLTNNLFSWLTLENLEERATPTRMLAYGTDGGVTSTVFIRTDADNNGTFESQAPQPNGPGAAVFTPFGSFIGGVRVAMGDIDGDGNDELITAAGAGGTPHVQIWRLGADGSIGALADSFFAYDPGFNGGVYVATGDLNGDGRAEVITGAGAGGGPHVKIWSDSNRNGRVSDGLTDSFYAYQWNFPGGVRVAAGDVNNNGKAEVITGAGFGGGPHVRVFTDTNANRKVSDEAPLSEFFAYDAGFKGGVFVSASRGSPHIITGAGEGGGSHIKVLNANGVENESIYPTYALTFQGGVRVAAGDARFSPGSPVEVIAVAGLGGSAHTRIFDDNADAGNKVSDNAPMDDFIASDVRTGWYVAFGNVINGNNNVPVGNPGNVGNGNAGNAGNVGNGNVANGANISIVATPQLTAYGAAVYAVTIQNGPGNTNFSVTTTAGVLTTRAPNALDSSNFTGIVTTGINGFVTFYLTTGISFTSTSATITATSGGITVSTGVNLATPSAMRYDFGTPTSPAQSGFVALTGNVIANSNTGVGWASSTAVADRNATVAQTNNLTRDIAWGNTGTNGTRTFRVFVGINVNYFARLYMGDTFQSYTGISISNDNGAGTITQAIPAAQTVKNAFSTVNIAGNAGADGFADITFSTTGNYWVANGLDIALSPANLPTSVI